MKKILLIIEATVFFFDLTKYFDVDLQWSTSVKIYK